MKPLHFLRHLVTTEEGGRNRPSYVVALPPTRGLSHCRFSVEVIERRDGALLNSPMRRYEFNQLPNFHAACSDPDCRQGGVYVTPIIWEMIMDNETERLLMEMCPGRVALADKSPVRVKCQGMFFIRLHFVRGFGA